jgi:hypothetical protein
MNRRFAVVACMALIAPLALAAGPPLRVGSQARAQGLGINVPVVGRLIGSGNTLFVTSVDIANNTAAATQVDFYFDGNDLTTGESIVVDGSLTNAGIRPAGTGTLRRYCNVHFDDFVSAMVDAGLVTATARDHGILGSLLVVYDGFDQRGEGSASARFENAFAGGTLGVALGGHVLTTGEPQELVATIRDTRGRAGTQVYSNLFVNNIGLTPSGEPAGPVTVELTARANSSGLSVGTPVVIENLGAGQTRVVGQVLTAMGVAPVTEDTILVFARVTSGNAAIAGAVSIVDAVTRDGSVIEMAGADLP